MSVFVGSIYRNILSIRKEDQKAPQIPIYDYECNWEKGHIVRAVKADGWKRGVN